MFARAPVGDTVVMSPSPALRRAERLLPGLLALGMSAFVAAVVTTINTGLDTGLPLRWLRAWTLAAPAAVVAAYLLRPLAWRLALAIAGARP